MVCVRRAWLTLAGVTYPLEDPAAGYFCTSFELGSPDVRDVVNNRPDRDGVDDRTRYFGARAVTAELITATSWGATIDQVATMFGPVMVPSARPTLHYVLDRPGTPERAIVVRAANYGWKLEGDAERQIQLQWVAADPVAYDPTDRSAVAWAGSATSAGRTYNLTFPRTYPPGGMPPTTANVTLPGDVAVSPLIRIYGPATAPHVTIYSTGPPPAYQNLGAQLVWFQASTQIDAGHWIDVDANRRTVYRDSDPAQNAVTSLDWSQTKWPLLQAGGASHQMVIQAGGANQVTQAVIMWRDGYLS